MPDLLPYADQQDRTFKELAKFMSEQQKKLLALVDEPEDFSPEEIYGDPNEL
jgi:hypothetical protein